MDGSPDQMEWIRGWIVTGMLILGLYGFIAEMRDRIEGGVPVPPKPDPEVCKIHSVDAADCLDMHKDEPPE